MDEIRDARLLDRLLLFLGKREAVRVEGSSMEPFISEGDVLIYERARELKLGDVVVARHPYKSGTRMIKRIGSITADGRFELIGDSPEESTDSRTFGTVSPSSIVGRVACRIVQ
ncbi:MAG: nickel-type superoxide dismutase maturation protease [Acidobacteria bacterium]|nr:nickel-type superoxide dismutase maturation protease [Acidobacteriota bacterium]